MKAYKGFDTNLCCRGFQYAEGETYVVPDGTYFCMGDNRAGSVDSRRSEVGVVPEDSIKGKVVIRLFPFSKIKRF